MRHSKIFHARSQSPTTRLKLETAPRCDVRARHSRSPPPATISLANAFADQLQAAHSTTRRDCHAAQVRLLEHGDAFVREAHAHFARGFEPTTWPTVQRGRLLFTLLHVTASPTPKRCRHTATTAAPQREGVRGLRNAHACVHT